MEGADRSLFRKPDLDGSATSRGGGGGGRSGQNGEVVFTMDSLFDRNIVFGRI